MSKKVDKQFTELTEPVLEMPSPLVVTVDFCALLERCDDNLPRAYTIVGELKDLLR